MALHRQRRRKTAGLTPEDLADRFEASFAATLNGQLRHLPQDFAARVIADFEAQGLLVRASDGLYLRAPLSDRLLGEFWAVRA